MFASPHRALEAARYLDSEQYLAGQQEIVELRYVVDLPREVKVRGVLQRFQDRSSDIAVLLQQHGGRQVTRRGVDSIAEQQKLHHRNHHDHGERNPVATELDEFLDHHCEAAPPETEPRLRRFTSRLVRIYRAHWKLSFERVISSMNTSSSEGSLSSQCNWSLLRHGARVASSAALSRPDTCKLAPNGATMSTPGLPASCSCKLCSSSPVTGY